MKKLSFLSACSFLLLVAPLAAQENLIARNDKLRVAPAAAMFENYGTRSTKIANVDDRVKERFQKDFAGVSDAEWTSAGKEYIVHFSTDGMHYWAFRSKKGHCQGWLRHYDGAQLTNAVRSQLKKTFYDHSIMGVSEVHQSNKTIYFVTIADAVSYKIIRIDRDEMDVFQEFAKK